MYRDAQRRGCPCKNTRMQGHMGHVCRSYQGAGTRVSVAAICVTVNSQACSGGSPLPQCTCPRPPSKHISHWPSLPSCDLRVHPGNYQEAPGHTVPTGNAEPSPHRPAQSRGHRRAADPVAGDCRVFLRPHDIPMAGHILCAPEPQGRSGDGEAPRLLLSLGHPGQGWGSVTQPHRMPHRDDHRSWAQPSLQT